MSQSSCGSRINPRYGAVLIGLRKRRRARHGSIGKNGGRRTTGRSSTCPRAGDLDDGGVAVRQTGVTADVRLGIPQGRGRRTPVSGAALPARSCRVTGTARSRLCGASGTVSCRRPPQACDLSCPIAPSRARAVTAGA